LFQIGIVRGCKGIGGGGGKLLKTVSEEVLSRSTDTIATSVGRSLDDISYAVGRSADDISIGGAASSIARGATSVAANLPTIPLQAVTRVTPKIKASIVTTFRASASKGTRSPHKPGKLKRKTITVYRMEEATSLLNSVEGAADDRLLQDIILKQCLKRMGKVIGQELPEEAASMARAAVPNEAATIARSIVDDVVESAFDNSDDVFWQEMRQRLDILRYGEDAVTQTASAPSPSSPAAAGRSLESSVWTDVVMSDPTVVTMLIAARQTGGLVDEAGEVLLRPIARSSIEAVEEAADSLEIAARNMIKDTIDEVKFWEALTNRLYALKYGFDPTEDVIRSMVKDILNDPQLFINKMSDGVGNKLARKMAFQETVQNMPEVAKKLGDNAETIIKIFLNGKSTAKFKRPPGKMRLRWQKLKFQVATLMRDIRTKKGREVVAHSLGRWAKRFVQRRTDGRVDNRELADDPQGFRRFLNDTSLLSTSYYGDDDLNNNTDHNQTLLQHFHSIANASILTDLSTSSCALSSNATDDDSFEDGAKFKRADNYMKSVIRYMECRNIDLANDTAMELLLRQLMLVNATASTEEKVEEKIEYGQKFILENDYLMDRIIDERITRHVCQEDPADDDYYEEEEEEEDDRDVLLLQQQQYQGPLEGCGRSGSSSSSVGNAGNRMVKGLQQQQTPRTVNIQVIAIARPAVVSTAAPVTIVLPSVAEAFAKFSRDFYRSRHLSIKPATTTIPPL
jgi:hypothetical protein